MRVGLRPYEEKIVWAWQYRCSNRSGRSFRASDRTPPCGSRVLFCDTPANLSRYNPGTPGTTPPSAPDTIRTCDLCLKEGDPTLQLSN